MTQTKRKSLAEALTTVGTGFIISYLVQVLIVNPLYDLPLSHAKSLGVTCIFTVASILRVYFVRRFFESTSTRRGY